MTRKSRRRRAFLVAVLLVTREATAGGTSSTYGETYSDCLGRNIVGASFGGGLGGGGAGGTDGAGTSRGAAFLLGIDYLFRSTTWLELGGRLAYVNIESFHQWSASAAARVFVAFGYRGQGEVGLSLRYGPALFTVAAPGTWVGQYAGVGLDGRWWIGQMGIQFGPEVALTTGKRTAAVPVNWADRESENGGSLVLGFIGTALFRP